MEGANNSNDIWVLKSRGGEIVSIFRDWECSKKDISLCGFALSRGLDYLWVKTSAVYDRKCNGLSTKWFLILHKKFKWYLCRVPQSIFEKRLHLHRKSLESNILRSKDRHHWPSFLLFGEVPKTCFKFIFNLFLFGHVWFPLNLKSGKKEEQKKKNKTKWRIHLEKPKKSKWLLCQFI